MLSLSQGRLSFLSDRAAALKAERDRRLHGVGHTARRFFRVLPEALQVQHHQFRARLALVTERLHGVRANFMVLLFAFWELQNPLNLNALQEANEFLATLQQVVALGKTRDQANAAYVSVTCCAPSFVRFNLLVRCCAPSFVLSNLLFKAGKKLQLAHNRIQRADADAKDADLEEDEEEKLRLQAVARAAVDAAKAGLELARRNFEAAEVVSAPLYFVCSA
jgi:hypothetical protein